MIHAHCYQGQIQYFWGDRSVDGWYLEVAGPQNVEN